MGKAPSTERSTQQVNDFLSSLLPVRAFAYELRIFPNKEGTSTHTVLSSTQIQRAAAGQSQPRGSRFLFLTTSPSPCAACGSPGPLSWQCDVEEQKQLRGTFLPHRTNLIPGCQHSVPPAICQVRIFLFMADIEASTLNLNMSKNSQLNLLWNHGV